MGTQGADVAGPVPRVGGNRAAVPGRCRRCAGGPVLGYVGGLRRKHGPRRNPTVGFRDGLLELRRAGSRTGHRLRLSRPGPVGLAAARANRRGRLGADSPDVVMAGEAPGGDGGGRCRDGSRCGAPVLVLGSGRLVRALRRAAAPDLGNAGVCGSRGCHGGGRAARPRRSMGTPHPVLATGGSRLDRVGGCGRLRRAQPAHPGVRAERLGCGVEPDRRRPARQGGDRDVGRCRGRAGGQICGQRQPPPARASRASGGSAVEMAAAGSRRPASRPVEGTHEAPSTMSSR